MNELINIQEQYEFDVYGKRGILIERGEGVHVFDSNGKKYLDCAAGIGVASIGHANKEVADAIYKQLKKISVVPGMFYNDAKAKLLQKLIQITSQNLTRTFLTNSGTESIEGAIKFTRYTTGKTDFVCAMKSFHGRTIGSLSATFKKQYKEEFAPLVPGFSFAPMNNYEKFISKVTDKTAGIILELVQGEGGVNIADKSFIKDIRKFCDENNLILIIDEVQTGFGRTGKMFAYENYDIQPDILCVAKAMGGGIPVGAIICDSKIKIPFGKHGSTFGGNPVASAAALATIKFIEQNKLVCNSKLQGEKLLTKLKAIESSKIREVRGLGLMIAIELKEKVKPYMQKLLDEGIIVLSAGLTVLRLLPPLIIEDNEINMIVEKIEKVLS